ncbi:hypothetical protein KP509_30G061200 [Ceratopteris richardii]|uniref:Uncharacterized protein n=1 Tax=Ceratopteris richardii TaxID=49495 RepID=A0A8T2R4J9_CERRI|nr:hypothetical protein KP509_30G061200 [Ceratopteris richardii]
MERLSKLIYSQKRYSVSLCSNQRRSKGNEWVELFVQEMLSAARLHDARNRATRALEAFKNAMIARSGSLFQELQNENVVLKEQIHNLIKENHILKRAVAIRHERNADHENFPQDMQ